MHVCEVAVNSYFMTDPYIGLIDRCGDIGGREGCLGFLILIIISGKVPD